MGEYRSANRSTEPATPELRGQEVAPGVQPMRRFLLRRWQDPSGVSGLGTVADGVAWSDDTVVLRWLGTTTGVRQICVFMSLDDLMRVHGHGGRSEVLWLDPWQVDGAAGPVRIGGYVD
ncbi:hypothetical protein [Longispora urticae]